MDSGAVQPIDAGAVLRSRYRSRLPARLDDLAGPTSGTVDLPLHVVWSGRRSFGLEHPKARMGLYRTVLAEGQREDVARYLNKDLLTAEWPVLRRLISRHIREVWEEAFPELAWSRPVRDRVGSRTSRAAERKC
ncbi:hypothetical protein [Streptomyces sp. CC219B]|uniref:hypothetical protein n=1 Tax=Streptomyces sp. CC219B TaxID=3044574 RepID=UPI0024A7A928|nr:hypothetical protein [Streptomyces sp. CC219B]